jgi:murein DD-endopeptidase MepM/ murein hydrolase activator NlpD
MPIILSIGCKVSKKADMSKSTREHKTGRESKNSYYRLAIINDQSHKHLWTVHFTKTSLFVTIVTLLVTLSAAIFLIIAYTPVRTFIPGYQDARSKRAAIQNAITIDSLETVIYKWGLYSENLKRVMEGMDPIKIDTLVNAGMKSVSKDADLSEIHRKDSLLREKVKEEEQFGISADRGKRDLPIEGLHFFCPLNGVISQAYNPADHPFIDITAPAGSVVKAALDGTVISAGWSNDSGYTIQLQHEGDIISIYKHNEKLLKKSGDKVSAGAPIALVGNTGDLSTGTHLHFELWHKGEAVDPARYINF